MDLKTILIVAAAVAAIIIVMLFRRDGARRIGMDDAPGGAVGAGPRQADPPRQTAATRSADLPGLSPSDIAEVAHLLGSRRKIEAIKLVREVTGMGLKEAKECVEHYQAGGAQPGGNPWKTRR